MIQLALNDIEPKEIFPGHWSRLVHGERITLSYVDIKEGLEVPVHSHPNEQILTMIDGSYELTMDGKPHVLPPGSILVIPADTPHSGRALSDCRILDVFSPPREDYRKL